MERTIFIKGPNPKLELAYNDVWLSGLFSRRLLVFETPVESSQIKAIEVIEQALQFLVDGTPELGSLSVIVPEAEHDGKTPWRALAPYKGIEFIVKDLTETFPSYGDLQNQGFPISAFKDRVLMPIPYRIEPAPQPQVKIQASLIREGLLLSICIFHHLTDGNGMNTIVRALRHACKLAAAITTTQFPRAPIKLNTDRTLMHSVHGTQTDLKHHPAYHFTPDVYRPRTDAPPKGVPSSGATQLDSTAVSFRLPSARATQLKLDAASSAPISTHDAITALLWRTLILARCSAGHLAATDTAVFSFPVDARRHLGLPADWVGNCVYFCVVERPVAAFQRPVGTADAATDEAEVAAAVVREIATQINAARSAVDPARVAGLMTRRRADPYSLAWWPAARAGDPKVLMFTSFYHSGMLDGTWGGALGRVRHFTTSDVGSMAGGFERTAFVGPRIGGGKGCDVVVGVDAAELAFFKADKQWSSYFDPLRE